MRYIRPIFVTGCDAPPDALVWGRYWFTHVEILARTADPVTLPVNQLQSDPTTDWATPQANPLIMGILNVTPDSFSDGGNHNDLNAAVAHANAMVQAGAHILDIGGESTRPGAEQVSIQEEIRRTAPVIEAITKAGLSARVSIDTRKAAVADAAINAGAQIVNDVSGFTFDLDLAGLCADRGVDVCVMHSQGRPETMQDNPAYDDVVLDVFDYLVGRIQFLEEAGIPRKRIIADPGIGFGKTRAHNLALLRRLGLFHGLGVPILLGASRKRFIGDIANIPNAKDRAAGSVGVALAALGQGVQMLRVHDVADHAQAIALWQAAVAHDGHD